MFKYIPLLRAVYMSFFDYSLMNPPGNFLGLGNYVLLFKSSVFWTAFGNTLAFSALYIGLTFWVPIVQALFLNEIHRNNSLFRVLYLLPAAVPAVAGLVLWKWIYNPDYGLLNEWLALVGLGPYNWLSDPAIAKLAIVIPSMLGGGINVLIYYSALRSIPEETVEAAKIDGANPWQRILSVIFPGLRFIIGIQFVAFIAAVFLSFEPMYIMTGGGPVDSTRVLTMLVFDYAFQSYRFGLAGAISFIMFLLIAAITIVQLRLSKDQTQ